jgi:hypothetical protein
VAVPYLTDISKGGAESTVAKGEHRTALLAAVVAAFKLPVEQLLLRIRMPGQAGMTAATKTAQFACVVALEAMNSTLESAGGLNVAAAHQSAAEILLLLAGAGGQAGMPGFPVRQTNLSGLWCHLASRGDLLVKITEGSHSGASGIISAAPPAAPAPEPAPPPPGPPGEP